MPKEHLVRQGESVMQLAEEQGLFWQTVWDHPKNSKLKLMRKDPDILLPGDTLHIPDRERREESAITEQKHKFKVKGTPAKFVLVLMHTPKNEDPTESLQTEDWQFCEPDPVVVEDEPRADVPYRLYADRVLIAEGITGNDGKIEEVIPAAARKGTLLLFPGSNKAQTIDLNWGHMDPIDELVGVCKRLNNLGFPCSHSEKEDSAQLRTALRAFQLSQELTLTGEADDATRSKLYEIYGG